MHDSTNPVALVTGAGRGIGREVAAQLTGYRVSKAALNAMTRILSTELEGEGVLVNSACPGLVTTDMGGPIGATKPVEDGAAGVVWLATCPMMDPRAGSSGWVACGVLTRNRGLGGGYLLEHT